MSATPLKVALIGNPNCGKTTLFNSLTGSRQKVGNWPGVTIERKVGYFQLPSGRNVELVDLPGIYSLEQQQFGLDEAIARRFLTEEGVDVILNILDATCLDRQLLLTHQLCDLHIPMVVAVNMLDVARQHRLDIDLAALESELGLPVVGIVAARSEGVKPVVTCLEKATVPFRTAPEEANLDRRLALRLTEIRQWASKAVHPQGYGQTMTERIDQVVLNPFLGVPVFLLMMYLLFTFAINVGAVFIDFFDILLGAWLVEGGHSLLAAISAPEALRVLLADGLGGGFQLVGTFIPVIGFLYLGLSFLESSGYMARAAFVVDRMMRAIGLPGRAFVPLIVGFGCNVPSVMAARSLNRESDRMVTVAMVPFMSCGARLTVFALFAVAFFPEQGQNVVFGLYLFGIAMAVLTGWLFRKAFSDEALSSSIMEFPAYHRPTLNNLLIATWHRLRAFCMRAGKTIVTVVVILSFLNSWGTDGSFGNENRQNSVLSAIAQKATPLLAPLGIQEDNWPATVGIITGIFAKEAVVGTLDALYTDVAGVQIDETDDTGLWTHSLAALISIKDNSLALADSLTDPLGIRLGHYQSLEAAAEEQGVRTTTLREMNRLFVTPFAAFCYLLLILLYTPCVATMGALVRESGPRWGWVVIGWSTALAYGVAVIVYQLGTLPAHPISSTSWTLAMLFMLWTAYHGLHWVGRPATRRDPDRIPITQL